MRFNGPVRVHSATVLHCSIRPRKQFADIHRRRHRSTEVTPFLLQVIFRRRPSQIPYHVAVDSCNSVLKRCGIAGLHVFLSSDEKQSRGGLSNQIFFVSIKLWSTVVSSIEDKILLRHAIIPHPWMNICSKFTMRFSFCRFCFTRSWISRHSPVLELC